MMDDFKKALILRPLEPQDEAAFLAALQEWDSSPGFIFASGYVSTMKFADYVGLLTANARGEKLPQGYVPATMLCAFVGNEIVGRISIRHHLNELLLKLGGHIGYGVLPKFRRNGYATEMLSQALLYAKDLGIKKALLTCDDDNFASIKVIEKNGGKLENKVDAGGARPLKRRYWIDLNT